MSEMDTEKMRTLGRTLVLKAFKEAGPNEHLTPKNIFAKLRVGLVRMGKKNEEAIHGALAGLVSDRILLKVMLEPNNPRLVLYRLNEDLTRAHDALTRADEHLQDAFGLLD